MVFSIDDFEYLPFWSAAWNAVIFWEAMNKSNQWRLTRVTQNHWTDKFIKAMPYTGRWAEVTSILHLFHVHMGAYTPFTFRGLVDFLILAEGRVDSLGNTPLGRSDAAIQLINTALIAPAAIQQLPIQRMIAGHVFTSFQEMYQNAMKIARVIEETEAEGRPMGPTKRKFGPGGSSTQGNKKFRNFNPAKDRGKRVQVAPRQEIEPCNQCGRLHYGPWKYGTQGCYGCCAMDHKLANCPRKARNRQGNIPSSATGTNPVSQRGRPPVNTTSGGNRGGKRPQAGGRVFSLEGGEAENPTATVSGTLHAHV